MRTNNADEKFVQILPVTEDPADVPFEIVPPERKLDAEKSLTAPNDVRGLVYVIFRTIGGSPRLERWAMIPLRTPGPSGFSDRGGRRIEAHAGQ